MTDFARERACAAAPLPAGLRSQLKGYQWARDNVGMSGGAVYRLHGKVGAPDLFLKHGSGSLADEVTDEMGGGRAERIFAPVPPDPGIRMSL